MSSALIIIDMQNDFCHGGALAVKDGEKLVEPINSAQENPGFSGFSPFDLRQANASLTEPS